MSRDGFFWGGGGGSPGELPRAVLHSAAASWFNSRNISSLALGGQVQSQVACGSVREGGRTLPSLFRFLVLPTILRPLAGAASHPSRSRGIPSPRLCVGHTRAHTHVLTSSSLVHVCKDLTLQQDTGQHAAGGIAGDREEHSKAPRPHSIERGTWGSLGEEALLASAGPIPRKAWV